MAANGSVPHLRNIFILTTLQDVNMRALQRYRFRESSFGSSGLLPLRNGMFSCKAMNLSNVMQTMM